MPIQKSTAAAVSDRIDFFVFITPSPVKRLCQYSSETGPFETDLPSLTNLFKPQFEFQLLPAYFQQTIWICELNIKIVPFNF